MIAGIRYRLWRVTTFARTGYWPTSERVCPEWADANFQNHLKAYKFLTQFAIGKRVLEIGCGTGYGAHLLAELALSVTAIDYSPRTVKYAAKRYSRPNLSYAVMSAEKLDLGSQKFDLVFSSEVFEHLHDHDAHLSQVAELLPPGGLCFVATPNPELTENMSPYHTHEWTFGELKALMLQYFSNVEIVEAINNPPTPHQAGLRATRWSSGEVGLDPRKDFAIRGVNVNREYLSNTHSFFVFAHSL
jgi:2-polyprenyl-3-methyl-5-hydroxy-6-metoxy-1,4-benzoquinol methylase